MRRAPALHTHADVRGVSGVRILKVLTAEEAAIGPYSPGDVLVWNTNADDRFAGTISSGSDVGGAIQVKVGEKPEVSPGDIIRLRESSSLVSILYRRGSASNTLFTTEQCNSLCLMCSQPPRQEDDSWRIDELHQTIELVDRSETILGFTGGEPTLLGSALGQLLLHCRTSLPDTSLHVLTNGRAFADGAFAQHIVEAGGDRTVWAVPLYADVASIHDEIVGAPGAFEETVEGLHQLARLKARVEVRVVLHALSVPRLCQLASFIYRRMPFAEHVALMGLEPMGLAKTNRSKLWIDPLDYAPALRAATHHLAVRGIATSIYNLPLCVLPRAVWEFARQSISDWKNVTDDICTACTVREQCAGFFISAGREWRSRGISPVLEGSHELA